MAQIANSEAPLPKLRRSDGEIYAALLVLERLCDAVSEGEFGDMGFTKAMARQAVITALGEAFGLS
jgi:hypothetical protein